MCTMKKLKSLALMAAVLLTGCFGTNQLFAKKFDPFTESKQDYDKRVQWFRDAKFGVMLYWNPSSLIGQEIGWSRPGYGAEKYDQLYKQFKGERCSRDLGISFV